MTVTSPFTIALLDDHQVVMESFANLLATSSQFQVVGMATHKQALLTILNQGRTDHQPVDVLVIDLLMPTVNAIELIPMVKTQYMNLSVLVLSGADDPLLIQQAIRAGADGYVSKAADKNELFEAILAVATGHRHIDSRVFSMNRPAVSCSTDHPLTERETQVASLILDELSSMQIAERLFISFNTVETHRKRIYQKLGITTSLGLMKYSLRCGL